MKVIQFNLCEGGEGEHWFSNLVNFVNAQKVDVLCLSELNFWHLNDSEKLNRFKEKTGFSFHVFSKSNSDYDLTIFSKFPINYHKILKEDFNHSTIFAEINNVNFVFTHLSPLSEDARLKEIDKILDQIDLDKKTVLIGDLNSLSPLDSYDDEEIISDSDKIGFYKFGKDKVRKDVQQRILDFGLIDSVRNFSNDFEYSVPTEFNKDEAHFSKLRLDYLYITPPLKSHLKSSKIIRKEETNQLSDHFPIIAEFDL